MIMDCDVTMSCQVLATSLDLQGDGKAHILAMDLGRVTHTFLKYGHRYKYNIREFEL